MSRIVAGLALLGLGSMTILANSMAAEKNASGLLGHKVNSLAGKEVDLSTAYQGKVLLVVNVASQCGYTPQYKQLQALHEKYAEKGLNVLGFPCNQFGGQEPGSSEQISSFCQKNYGVKFDLFEKVDVKGATANAFFKDLTSGAGNPKLAKEIGWNFEKFLIGRDGKLITRYGSGVKPDDPSVIAAIEAALAK